MRNRRPYKENPPGRRVSVWEAVTEWSGARASILRYVGSNPTRLSFSNIAPTQVSYEKPVTGRADQRVQP